MHIRINKTVLENILIHAQPFLEKKDSSQITSHLYLEATIDNVLTVKASDFEIGIVIESNRIQTSEPGIATANGKKILDIIRILNDSDIDLQAKNGMLDIQQGHSEFQLPMYDASAYPPFPQIEGKPEIDLKAQNLISALKKITPAADTNNPKFELNGALLDIQTDTINFVATDTRRLALVNKKESHGEPLSLILPKKAIIEIQKLFSNDITIYYDETYLLIVSDQYHFFTKLINGKFPDYNRIIPPHMAHTLLLPKNDFVGAVKMIGTVSNDLKVTVEKERILFESLSDENNKASTEIPFASNIDSPFVLAVNSRYILDFLGQTEQSEFTLGLNEPNMPFMLEEGDFKTIVMPIVI